MQCRKYAAENISVACFICCWGEKVRENKYSLRSVHVCKTFPLVTAQILYEKNIYPLYYYYYYWRHLNLNKVCDLTKADHPLGLI